MNVRIHLRCTTRQLHSERPPFTPQSLDSIKSVLHKSQPFSNSFPPPHSVMSSRPPSESAILIPLMNIDDQPCILLEVRASRMRVHAGEVSFPGGKVDPTDLSLVQAALREAQEELAVPSENVEILGAMEPAYSLGNRSRVWPFVGFVHDSPGHSSSKTSAESLTSLPFSSLRAAPNEVASIFPLPLSALVDPTRHSIHYFRLDQRRPYWKVRVGDLVEDQGRSTEDGKKDDDLEAWGLSGWFLNRFAWKIGWLEKPEPETLEG